MRLTNEISLNFFVVQLEPEELGARLLSACLRISLEILHCQLQLCDLLLQHLQCVICDVYIYYVLCICVSCNLAFVGQPNAGTYARYVYVCVCDVYMYHMCVYHMCVYQECIICVCISRNLAFVGQPNVVLALGFESSHCLLSN